MSFNRLVSIVLFSCLGSSFLIGQVTPFKGGSDDGAWNAVKSTSVCLAQAGVSPFSGSPGSGGDFSAIIQTACSIVSAPAPFSGGYDSAGIFASAIHAECITAASPSPFMGSISDGSASWRRTNQNCFGPNSTIDSIAPLQVCEGDSVFISGTRFSNVTSVAFNGTPSQQFTISDSVSIVAIVPIGATSGSVEVNGPEGTATSTAVLSISPLPGAAFTFIQTGLTFDFTSTSTNASAYFWDFGNGDTSDVQNPTVSFDAEGVYPVTLITSNACGTDTLTTDIDIKALQVARVTPELLEVSIVPNPFGESFQLGMNTTGPVQLVVFNPLGQVVYTEFFSTSGTTNKTIDTGRFASGVYSVQINSLKGSVLKRIIKY